MTDKIKSLNEILPSDKRVIESISLSKIAGETLTINGAKPLATDKPSFWLADVVVTSTGKRYQITVSQVQIIEALKWLTDNAALPVMAVIANLGKSYALVDPSEYKPS